MSYNGGNCNRGMSGALTMGADYEGGYDVSDDQHEQSETVSPAESETTVAGMITEMRAGKVSRRRLVAALSGLGLTAAGAAAVIATTRPSAVQESRGSAAEVERVLRLHDQHLARQVGGNTSTMAQDYAEDAVVNDPLFAQPFVGRDAIAKRYAAEVASVPDRSLRVINRTMNGNELVVEWEATGTHANSFLGLDRK